MSGPGTAAWAAWASWTVAMVVVVADAVRRRRWARLLESLGARRGRARSGARTALAALAAVLAGQALVGSGSSPAADTADGAGGDVVLLMDVSRSMSARDAEPDRGAVARLAALRIATGAESARIGVAAFAARGFLLLPPTSDRGLISLYLESLDPAVVSGSGSNLGSALSVAVRAVAVHAEARGGRGGAVVLLSDGEGFGEEAELERALDAAVDAGVHVHTVGVGSAGGAPVPGVAWSPRTFARPATLRRIAERTGGVAIQAADGSAVAGLTERLRRGGPPGAPSGKAADGRDPPQEPEAPVSGWVLCALLALAAEGVWGARRSP